MDIKYMINPSCEFIDVEDGVVCLEENMETIYFVDVIEKIILYQFKTPLTQDELKNSLVDYIENIIDNELFDFLNILINKKIIIPHEHS